jgi:hypothetical protein
MLSTPARSDFRGALVRDPARVCQRLIESPRQFGLEFVSTAGGDLDNEDWEEVGRLEGEAGALRDSWFDDDPVRGYPAGYRTLPRAVLRVAVLSSLLWRMLTKLSMQQQQQEAIGPSRPGVSSPSYRDQY